MSKSRWWVWLLGGVLGVWAMAGPARATEQQLEASLEGIGVEERLGQSVPIDLTVTDEDGQQRSLGHYLGRGKPVVLNLGYYGCPMLCGLVLNGFLEALKGVELTPGQDFDIVTVSIDPKEGTALAKAKRQNYLDRLGREGAEAGWHFHTADESTIKRLADSVGFGFRYDEVQKQFAHPAVLFVLTEDGRISRYLYGIEVKPRDLKLAILEASEGGIGTTIDRLILYCFHYDPQANSYVLFAMNLMRLAGGLTVLVVGSLLFPVWFRSWRNREQLATVAEGTHE